VGGSQIGEPIVVLSMGAHGAERDFAGGLMESLLLPARPALRKPKMLSEHPPTQ